MRVCIDDFDTIFKKMNEFTVEIFNEDGKTQIIIEGRERRDKIEISLYTKDGHFEYDHYEE